MTISYLLNVGVYNWVMLRLHEVQHSRFWVSVTVLTLFLFKVPAILWQTDPIQDNSVAKPAAQIKVYF